MAKRVLIILLLQIIFHALKAQENPPVNEQQLENLTENIKEDQIEDDSYLQELEQFINDPINLNSADEAELNQLKILTPIQIKNLIVYRNLFGSLKSIYEIQAIPGWNIGVIRRILPYVFIKADESLLSTLGTRLKNGQYSILGRASQTLEKSQGYIYDSTKNYYIGSPIKLLVRYKYSYKNLLQYGIIGAKDAGEEFFKGSQKGGFDFYSFHFFVRDRQKLLELTEPPI